MSDTTPKWTPGPWMPSRNRLDGVEWFVKSAAKNLHPFDWMPRLNIKLEPLEAIHPAKNVNSRSGSVPDVECCATAVQENAANAHLIAAAPDLYEALEGLLYDFDLQMKNPSHHMPFNYSKATAALAKARGE